MGAPVRIADEAAGSRRILRACLGEWGDDVLVTYDGIEAWRVLLGDTGPVLVLPGGKTRQRYHPGRRRARCERPNHGGARSTAPAARGRRPE